MMIGPQGEVIRTPYPEETMNEAMRQAYREYCQQMHPKLDNTQLDKLVELMPASNPDWVKDQFEEARRLDPYTDDKDLCAELGRRLISTPPHDVTSIFPPTDQTDEEKEQREKLERLRQARDGFMFTQQE